MAFTPYDPNTGTFAPSNNNYLPAPPQKAKLGQGAAGEFAGNALRSITAPLVRTGAAIESGLDQTLGRVGNAIRGRGFTPTTTGQQAQAAANRIGAGADDTFAGKVGTGVGTIAPYFTPAGGEKEIAGLLSHLGLDATNFAPKIATYLAKAAPTVARDVSVGTAQTGDIKSGAVQGIGGAVGAGILGKGVKAITNRPTRDFASEFTSAEVNKALAKDAIKRGSARVGEKKGILGQSQIIPNSQDERIANSVRDVVSPKNTLIKNVDAIHKKISGLNKGVGEYIENNNVPLDEGKLQAKLAAAKENHNLLFAGDDKAHQVYDAVTNEFMKQLSSKDTKGLFQNRQGFDKYLQTKIPNLFKKDATGQFLDPRDSVRQNAALDVRKAVNQYISESLPEGNPYKQTLEQESDMLTALQRIADKNAGKISKNNLKLLINRHPILSTMGISALSALGVGAASNAVHAAIQSNGN